VNVQLLTAAILFVADLLLVIAAQVGAFLALTQRAGGEYLAQQKQEAIIEFALHSSKREIEFLTSAEGLPLAQQREPCGSWLAVPGLLSVLRIFRLFCSWFGARALLME
jgi:hypothetical protein